MSGKTFFGQSILTLYKAFKVTLFILHVATSAKHFCMANTVVDSVVNANLNLARHLKTILSRKTKNLKRKEDEKSWEKESNRNYHLLRRVVESGNCRRVTAATGERNPNKCTNVLPARKRLVE